MATSETDDGEPGPILPTSEKQQKPSYGSSPSSSPGEKMKRPSSTTRRKEAWWKIHLFRGMIDDVRRRAPYYGRDWLDAWDYRVVPATVYMYFAKYVIRPAPCDASRRLPETSVQGRRLSRVRHLAQGRS